MFFDTVALSSDEDGTRAGTPREGELVRLDAEWTLGSHQQNHEPTYLTSLRTPPSPVAWCESRPARYRNVPEFHAANRPRVASGVTWRN
ncbi:hypothetical protein NPIL_607511 [Nephila pilipes]|uniref:Uncharacterized protein n=1 Tax=Nephila pilipes TaxID=299642 RepID=A0A8X6TFC7_NEPPI|nr:hypothetical protein NPIL_607511 [Nephila pilipes]